MPPMIRIADQDVHVHVSEATIYESGEFAGSIQFFIRFYGPVNDKTIRKHLRLAVAGELEVLEPTGYEALDDGLNVSFFSAEISNSGQLPFAAEVLWVEGDHVTSLGALSFHKASAWELKEKSETAHLP